MTDNCNAENLLRKALAITEIPVDFDPNKIPQTGEEYIHYVMYEAKQCKEWIKVDISQEKLKNNQQLIVTEPGGCASAPKEFLPSIAWQHKQLADFSAFRLHVQQIKAQRQESNSQFNGEVEQWQKKCSTPPNLSDLMCLNQKSVCKVLGYVLEWLGEVAEQETIGYGHGVWLYALLSCLETPLMPENCSILREIARECSQIRSKLDQSATEELFKPLNLFICIIARYFHNYDLIDNVNEL